MPDGKTFMHLDHFENEEAHEFLTNLESFKKILPLNWMPAGWKFEPKLELLSLVASSEDFFG